MKKYALLIGVEEYRDKMISRLQFARADATALAERFHNRCGFDGVRVLADQSGENTPDLVNIVTALRDMAAELRDEDLFLFFFAGHGIERDGHGYLLARDSLQAFPEHGSLSLELLRKTFEYLGAGKRIILLDACRNSPDAGRGDSANCMGDVISRDIVAAARSRLAAGTTTALLSACCSGQRAYEWPAKKHGVFTECLIQGLDGAAWRGGELEFNRLAGYAAREVRQWAANMPGLPMPQEPWYEQFGDPEPILLAERPCPPVSSPENPRPTSPRSAPTKMATTWWVVIEGKEHGPLDAAAMQDNIQRGHILRDSACWRAGMEDWRPIAEIDEWAGAFSLLTPSPVVRPPKRGSSIALPAFLEPVPDARYARLGGLNAGSEAAQKLQRQWEEKGHPLEVRMQKTGIVLRLIPPGEFLMGSGKEDAETRDDERPQHNVTVGNPMYVGKFPVTQEQWFAVMGENPAHFQTGLILKEQSPKKRFWSKQEIVVRDEVRLKIDTKEHPVDSVSWNDCQEFLNRLYDKLDLEVGQEIRLLTEAEWEYACRAGTSASRYGKLDVIAWHRDKDGGITHQVGQKRANAWGLHDMLGNVWEWCEDNWHTDYKNAPADGSSWQGGLSSRVVRGDFLYFPLTCRSALRYWGEPGNRNSYVGFRVVYSFED